ncbi:MAG TPA: oligosaccharide flippase family protein [Tahibacter sp.]|uniref:oligosaccharide flippase family protein n=1 Tax=Tahibacter sp. TaxID=2056211 RepID=UPI002CB88B05|nr:oligosaccharide flippase family protein [Tahibacter sp.]HSX59237.1 oligosaccharide flippase family protein [Tahibacter sp.]
MKAFARAIAAFGVGSAAGTLLQVLKGKLAALVLGTAGVGVLNQLGTTWSLFSSVAGLGMGSGMVKRVAAAREAGDEAAILRQVTSSLAVAAAVSLVLALAATAFAAALSDGLFHDGGERRVLVLLVAWGIPFAVCAQVYRCLLSAARQARALVRAQVTSDLIGFAAFALLVWRYGLPGAVLSLSLLHAVKFALLFGAARRHYGANTLALAPARFDWREVRHNLGFGLSGLLLVTTGSLVVLIVSRWIIAAQGLDAAGLYSTAWKVAAVYLGAIYASAGSYYFPTLAACDGDDRRLGNCIDESLTVYLYFIAPVIAAIVLAGEWLMHLLFSAAFVPAAALLVLLLPGDLLRIVSETLGLSLLARRRLGAYCGVYFAWAASYLALAALLLPRLQLAGAALAYLLSQALQFVVTLYVVRRAFGYRIGRTAAFALLRGALLVAAAAVAALLSRDLALRVAAGVAIAAAWLALSWSDLHFRELAAGLFRRLRMRPS